MKKLTSILAAALTLAACGKADDPADQYRKVLPTSNTLTITAPDTAGTAAAPATGLVSRAVTAEGKSDLAVISYVFSASVNWGVAAMLWQLHAVTYWPATSCDDSSCTWGPGSSATDVNVFKLVVTKNGASYDYELSAAPKSTGGTLFVPIIFGTARPGSIDHRGDGSFTIDFDADAALDHADGWVRDQWGTLDVVYDTRNELQNMVTWRNAKDSDNPGADPANPNRVDVRFDFDETGPGGDLLLAIRTLPTGDTSKELSLHTRWNDDGQGRADLRYADFTTTHDESECWDGRPDFLQTYDNFPSIVGSADACAFTPSFLDFPAL